MRPSDESLTTDYMRDLEVDIEQNEILIPQGRVDLIDYNEKCKAELSRLRSAKNIVVSRYGVPSAID